ncbi:hypothetical protein [Azospirillum soli]|uniref:hypothetical protein n=1 Tax=Azospirillum soli TaxID=1304799 RepID=UPI001AE50709|nr:hypothetical protein [Azospirillum soli]MBP2316869.1 hypothetical protein [Azospirillum soli]
MSQYIQAAEPIGHVSSFVAPAQKRLAGMPLVATWMLLVSAPWVAIYQLAKLVF